MLQMTIYGRIHNSIDFEKTFDSVEWEFLFTLYTNIKWRVQVIMGIFQSILPGVDLLAKVVPYRCYYSY